MKQLIKILTLFVFVTSCNSSIANKESKEELINTPQQTVEEKTFEYSIDKATEGQIHTASLFRKYMDEKKYEQAIQLFSQKQQKNINAIQEEGMFEYWSAAWSFDDAKYDRYIKKIKTGKAIFIFEDGVWKIDEK